MVREGSPAADPTSKVGGFWGLRLIAIGASAEGKARSSSDWTRSENNPVESC